MLSLPSIETVGVSVAVGRCDNTQLRCEGGTTMPEKY
jgi:hypothetical protein